MTPIEKAIAKRIDRFDLSRGLRSVKQQLFLSPVAGIHKIKVGRIRFQDATNLRAMVENRRNYRLDFFRQSKDPYFRRDRCGKSCLNRNTMGTLMDSSDGEYFR